MLIATAPIIVFLFTAIVGTIKLSKGFIRAAPPWQDHKVN